MNDGMTQNPDGGAGDAADHVFCLVNVPSMTLANSAVLNAISLAPSVVNNAALTAIMPSMTLANSIVLNAITPSTAWAPEAIREWSGFDFADWMTQSRRLAATGIERLDDYAVVSHTKRIQRFRKPGDLEIAAMITVAVFLIVYISYSLAIIHDQRLAELARNDGPTPFEAAMAMGAFAFWLVHSRRSS
jgi:hypothetical protein